MSNKVTYRQQFTRCGKERCRKCRDGLGHGPYWYAYWSENGRTVSKYIGIHPPQHVELELHQPEKTDEPHIVPQQTGTQTLRIYVLGQFRIDRLEGNEWIPVATRTWYRRRPRALLGCLLSSVGRRIGINSNLIIRRAQVVALQVERHRQFGPGIRDRELE